MIIKAKPVDKAVEETEDHIRVRVRDPGDFKKDSFRIVVYSKSQGIKAVRGRLKSNNKWDVQAYLFVKEKNWTKEKAVKWVKEHEEKASEISTLLEEVEKAMGDKIKPEAKHKLINVNVVEVTLTGSPAVPAGTFLLLKSTTIPEGEEAFIKPTLFKAIDKTKRQVFGYCLVPDEPDYQGDVVSAEEVEKACHSFMRNLSYNEQRVTGGGLEHSMFADVGYPIQSVVDTNGCLGEGVSKGEGIKGAWWIGMQITNGDVWEAIEKGEIKGFSIGGTGKRIPLGDKEKSGGLAKIWETMRKVVGEARKDEEGPISYLEAYQSTRVRDDLYDMFSALTRSIFSILDTDKLEQPAKLEAIAATVDQFKNAMISFIQLIKAGKELSAANVGTITEAERTLGNALEGLQSVLNRIEDKEDKGKSKKKFTIQKIVSKKGEKGMTKEQEEQLAETLKTLSESLGKFDERLKGVEEKVSKMDAKPDPKDKGGDKKEDLEALTKGVADLKGQLEEVEKKLKNLETTPSTRKGGDDLPDPKVTEKKEEVPLAKKLEGTAFSFTKPQE